MTGRLDLNADVGEHDGPPSPAALTLLRLITSANIACGWHAGDATSMRHTVAECAASGVQIGAHPSYPDREGFGRRVLPLTPAEITDAVAHQVQALCAIADAEHARVSHVKPHGALYNLGCVDAAVAAAIAEGILVAGCAPVLYAPHGSALAAAGLDAGLRVVAEGFVDRCYEDDGTLTARDVPGAVLHDPEEARTRAVRWACTGQVLARSGRSLTLPLETLCVHGDTPDAARLAAAVRQALEGAGVDLRAALAP